MYGQSTSRIARMINPISGEPIIMKHELKESNKPFKPMFKQDIVTGEIKIDRRNEVYWKNEIDMN